MKRKGIVAMFLASLVMAAGAALVAMNWMQQQGSDDVAKVSQVVVATVEIPFGSRVQASDLKLMPMPPESVPEGSFSDIEDVVGRVNTQVVYAGEILHEGRVVEHMEGSALAAVLEQGKRAMSVRVDDVVGVAGFLLPGNRVDVVATQRNNGSRSNVESRTVLHNLKVLAVDQIASQDRDDPVIVRAVTLEVTPDEAETLVEATQEGKVQLTLRNPMDKDDDVSGLMAAQRSVLNLPEPVEKPEPAPRPVARRAPIQHQVSVLRGTQMSTVSVKN
ncbi:Flp pilus assembly protein CpaB [Halomonas nitroreducens]|uniref:Flp pilus assembly protein CpaB n=1 Tax=Halomonas nitroreducens TaxID=447425 RepID=A0A3S0HMY8_9GAMM|nr:Flp pilus assembly protein CpaB [Halomonas nitroreducens]RTQ99634.1 Flp pilus assembly protein CpaB [Halomonas nitroreducens]